MAGCHSPDEFLRGKHRIDTLLAHSMGIPQLSTRKAAKITWDDTFQNCGRDATSMPLGIAAKTPRPLLNGVSNTAEGQSCRGHNAPTEPSIFPSSAAPASTVTRQKQRRSSHGPLLSPCRKCRFQCSLRISHETRSSFHSEFWSSSFAHRRHMISKQVTNHPCNAENRSNRVRLGTRLRKYSREYYMRDDDGKYGSV